jgi:hypothetical protein
MAIALTTPFALAAGAGRGYLAGIADPPGLPQVRVGGRGRVHRTGADGGWWERADHDR